MRGLIQKRIATFIKNNPDICPPIIRFPIPDTFWNARLDRLLFRILNYYSSRLQMEKQKDLVTGYPTHLFVDVTNICNLRCPLCPTGAGTLNRKKGSMPLETFKKIVDEMHRYLISIDLFNWGEPLLHKHVYDMIRYAHNHHIVTSVSTNFNYFSELINSYYQAWFRFHPEIAVDLGIRGFESQLTPFADDDIGALTVLNGKLIDTLDEFDTSSLSDAQCIDLELMYGAAAIESAELIEQDWRYRDPARYLPIHAVYQLTLRHLEQNKQHLQYLLYQQSLHSLRY